jgi:rare lipoprotein A
MRLRLSTGVLCLALALLVSGCGKAIIRAPYGARCYTPTGPTGPGYQVPSYQVFGKTYYPLLAADGYVEEGMASWYGPEFQGLRTSSGEPFDMNAISCAHRTLPLGTTLQVTNLSNGRQAVVRVNDRGPFVDGRIVDLSLGTAKLLEMEGPGVVPVRLVALSNGRQGKPGGYDAGDFTIQVGAFREEARARLLTERLSGLGKPEILQVQRGEETYYRVRVARYASLTEALRFQGELRERGFTEAVVVAADASK